MDVITISLRVTAPERDVARVSTGRRQFTIGRPLEFDDASPRIAAVEYALGAIGGEVVNGFRVFADRRRLVVDAAEAIVTCELANGLAYLEVVGEETPPTIRRIHIKVFVATPDADAAKSLFAYVLERLPLVCTLRATTELVIELIVTS
jgi:hypothetical protein